MVFVMAGGGTAGHVMPLLAVARHLLRRNHPVLFLGSPHGLEARLVPAAGFPIEWVSTGPLQGVSFPRKLRTAALLPASVARCFRLLHRWRAAAVFSLGGYVAAPVVAAAFLRRLPVLVLEPNAAPGLVNRLSARFASHILLGLPDALPFFPAARTEVTGVPVRDEFFALPPKPPTPELSVLITGGSRGSRTLNRAFQDSWPLFLQARSPVRFLHQSGAAAAGSLARDFATTGLAGRVEPFIDDMPAAFAQADLVVSRSGAGAVAELAAAGKPSLLVPFPFATDNHQLANAQALARAGAARMILDAELSGQRLFDEITHFLHHPHLLQSMGQAARSLAKPGAATRVVELLERSIHPTRKRVDTAAESRKNTNNIS
jgi:UDP-N-acetylglucosamine--N-acetylmuramyl-(pentapeptide) pyrophosphoryl-undecaprenol N-acetylglucosamine transferase